MNCFLFGCFEGDGTDQVFAILYSSHLRVHVHVYYIHGKSGFALLRVTELTRCFCNIVQQPCFVYHVNHSVWSTASLVV